MIQSGKWPILAKLTTVGIAFTALASHTNTAGQVTLSVRSDVMPPSEVHYRGASSTRAFTAFEPYSINVMGIDTPVALYRAPRSHDFGGDIPFVNPVTGVADAGTIQAWDPLLNASRNLVGKDMSNAGFPGRVEKRNGLTMVRYNAGDGVTAGTCRTQLNSYPIPPRTQVRWELDVAFGADDIENQWILTPPMASRVLFWQVKSTVPGNPSMQAVVDTDPTNPLKLLAITFFLKGGKSTNFHQVAKVHGIQRNTPVPIVIEAFLDERTAADGGKGRMKVWVNGSAVGDAFGPTMTWGVGLHQWSMAMYLYDEPRPYRYTRASFWKTARMMVQPQLAQLEN